MKSLETLYVHTDHETEEHCASSMVAMVNN